MYTFLITHRESFYLVYFRWTFFSHQFLIWKINRLTAHTCFTGNIYMYVINMVIGRRKFKCYLKILILKLTSKIHNLTIFCEDVENVENECHDTSHTINQHCFRKCLLVMPDIATKHCLGQCWLRSMSLYGLAKYQCVNLAWYYIRSNIQTHCWLKPITD